MKRKYDPIAAQITELLDKMAECPTSGGNAILNFGRALLAAELQTRLFQAEMAEKQADNNPESKEAE